MSADSITFSLLISTGRTKEEKNKVGRNSYTKDHSFLSGSMFKHYYCYGVDGWGVYPQFWANLLKMPPKSRHHFCKYFILGKHNRMEHCWFPLPLVTIIKRSRILSKIRTFNYQKTDLLVNGKVIVTMQFQYINALVEQFNIALLAESIHHDYWSN